MAGHLGTLTLNLVAKIGGFTGPLDQVDRRVNKSRKNIKKYGKDSAASLKDLAGAFTTLAGAAGVTALVKNSMAATSEMQKMATMAGLNTTVFQELTYATSKYKVSQDALADGFKELALRAEEFAVTGAGPGKEAFERLGYSQDELNEKLKDTPTLFNEIIDRMQGMSEAAKMRLADEIFGGQGGEQFVAVVNGGTKALKDFQAEAHDLGLVMDEAMVQKSIDAEREVAKLGSVISSQLNQSVALIAPDITNVAEAMGGWVDENREFIQQELPGYIDGLKTSVGLLGKELTGVAKNIAVNSQAFALATEGQISWLDYLTKSTNELGEMVQAFDALSNSSSGPSFTEWQSQVKTLTDEYERLGSKIEDYEKLGSRIEDDESLKNSATKTLDALKSQREEIKKQIDALNDLAKVQEVVLSPTPGANHRNSYHDKMFSGNASSTDSITPTGNTGDAEKLTAQQAAAWQSAYSTLGTLTQSTFDAMKKQYRKDYDEFIKLTGDKETAEAVYAEKIAALSEKMYGDVADSRQQMAQGHAESIEQQLQAEIEAQEKKAEVLAEFTDAYKQMTMDSLDYELEKLQQEYDYYAQYIEDKAALDEWYAEKKAELLPQDEDYWSNFLSSMENNMQNMDQLLGSTIQGWTSQFGSFFASAILMDS